MKRIIMSIAFILFASILPLHTHAKMETWDIDKAHSSIYFDVKHTYATVRGYFSDFSGTITLDTEHHEKSIVEFDVKVDSINTHNSKRDNHLRSDEFFAAKKYPVMSFKSTHVEHAGDNRYMLHGNLTIKEVTKEVAVPFTYLGMRKNPLMKGKMVAGLEAHFTIDRLEYHVGDGKYHKMGVIGKDVRILISLEVLKDK